MPLLRICEIAAVSSKNKPHDLCYGDLLDPTLSTSAYPFDANDLEAAKTEL